MKFQTSSLRSKVARRIFSIFLLCALLPFAGLVVISYYQVKTFFDEKNHRQLHDLAKLYGMDVHERLQLLHGSLSVIASSIRLTGQLLDEDSLEKLPGLHKDRWHALSLFTSDHRRRDILSQLSVSPPEPTPQARKHRAAGRAVISIDPSAASGAPRLLMSVRIDPGNPDRGVLFGEIKETYLWGIGESRLMPSHIEACVQSHTGITLKCPPSMRSTLPDALMKQIGRSSVGNLQWAHDDRSYLASYWTIPMDYEFGTEGWVVVLRTTKEGALASIEDLRSTFLLGILASAGLSILLAIVQIRKRLIPVEKLKEVTERIARQEFGSRVDIQTDDEFAELADSINSMADQLGRQFDTLSTLFESTKQHAAELEKANKAKDDFLGVMSHELRTPLAIILGHVGILRGDLLGELNTAQAGAAAKIEKHSRELLALVNSILQATLIEADQVVVESQPLNLTELLAGLKTSYETPLEKPVNLMWRYPSDLPIINADKEKLLRILQNLVDNAIKFTSEGEVSILARSNPQNDVVEFAVVDTGVGIAKEERATIFEMFRQVDNSGTRNFEGLGLGLFIAKRFAQLMGGDIVVVSESGRGSTFTVTLPIVSDSGKFAVHSSPRQLTASR
jgi:signal transduction histidine kinase